MVKGGYVFFSIGTFVLSLTSCAEEEVKIQADDIQEVNLSSKVRTQKVSLRHFLRRLNSQQITSLS